MERTGYFNDQKVFETDLNNTEATKASQSVYRTQAPLGTSGGIGKNTGAWSGSGVFQGGVYGSPADYLNSTKNIYVTATSTSQLDIATGVALSPQGELIRVLTAQTLLFGGAQWPSGSGSSLNYVKVQYAETTGSVKVNNAGISFPTRYFGSYIFSVNNVAPSSQELLLATFTADGGGLISAGTFADRRTYIATVTPSSAVILDPTAKPVAAHTTVEDHVSAVGTGIPSITNPHGLSIADLTSAGTTLVDHLLDGHVSGIIPLARTSAAYNSYSGSLIPQPGATPDYIAFAPNVNAILSTGGQYYTASVAPLTAAQAPADGDYWIFAAPGPVAQFISTSVYPTIDALAPHAISNCLLASVTVSNVGLDMSNFVDRRQIWTLTQSDVRGDLTEGFQQPSASLPQTATLLDNLDRIRGQLTGGLQFVYRGAFQDSATSVPLGGNTPSGHTVIRTPNTGSWIDSQYSGFGMPYRGIVNSMTAHYTRVAALSGFNNLPQLKSMSVARTYANPVSYEAGDIIGVVVRQSGSIVDQINLNYSTGNQVNPGATILVDHSSFNGVVPQTGMFDGYWFCIRSDPSGSANQRSVRKVASFQANTPGAGVATITLDVALGPLNITDSPNTIIYANTTFMYLYRPIRFLIFKNNALQTMELHPPAPDTISPFFDAMVLVK